MTATTKVLLIHGTWASKAPWVKPDSPVAKRIKAEWPDATIEALYWSGANTFAAREQTAQELVKRLESDVPETRFLIIAHSHGGSVAHYAFRQAPALFDRVIGVACMATPFFGFSVRPGYANLLLAMIAALLVVLFESLLLAGVVVGRWMYRQFNDGTIPVLALGGLLLFGLLVIAISIYRRRQSIYKKLYASSSQIETWDTSVLQIPRAAFFRSMGDEVALGLNTGQFLTTLVNRILGMMARLADFCVHKLSNGWKSRTGKVALVATATVLIIAAALPFALVTEFGFIAKSWIQYVWIFHPSIDCMVCGSAPLDLIVKFLFQLFIALPLLLALMAALLLIVSFVSWFASFLILRSFGAWSAGSALAAEFAIEPTPEGVHYFCNTGWSRDVKALENERPILQHSDPYASKTALDALCNWMRTLIR